MTLDLTGLTLAGQPVSYTFTIPEGQWNYYHAQWYAYAFGTVVINQTESPTSIALFYAPGQPDFLTTWGAPIELRQPFKTLTPGALLLDHSGPSPFYFTLTSISDFDPPDGPSAVPEPSTWALMLLGLILFLLMESPANARHHHRHIHYGYHCRSGMIWLRHDRECVRKYAAAPRRAIQPAPVEPAPVAKKSDRLKKEDPTSDLPYWEPFPIMGRPTGRWWHI